MDHQRHRGFTVIELAVTLAIIGLLIALLLPAVQAAREAARRATCQNHLRQFGLALHNYHETHSVLPSGSIISGLSNGPRSGWGWGAMILPLIDEAPLYSRIDFESATVAGSNPMLIGQTVRVWQCPSDVAPSTVTIDLPATGPISVAAGNYCGCSGMLRALSGTRLADVTDGLSQTLMLGERVNQAGQLPFNDSFTSAWCGMLSTRSDFVFNSIPHLSVSRTIAINSSLLSPGAFTSRHFSGANFAMGDGSVQMINQHIDAAVFEALGTPDGREVVHAP